MRHVMRLMTAAALLVGLGGLTATAQPQQSGDGSSLLVNNKVVQAELKVTDEQAAKLREWSQDGRVKALEKGVQKMRAALKGLPVQEQLKKQRELEEEMREAMYKELGEILSPGQVKRLKQIQLQFIGAQAYFRPEVQAALKLTDEQKDKLRDIQQARFKDAQKLREEYGRPGQPPPKLADLDPDKRKELIEKQEAITREADRKSAAVLTEEQKKAWKELAGPPVDLDKIRQEMMDASRPKKKDD